MNKYRSRTDFVLSAVSDKCMILDIGFIGEYSEPFIHNAIINHTKAFVVGIDISEKIESLNNGERVKYFKKSVYELNSDTSFKGKFDAVVMCEVIEHLNHPWQALENAASALRDEGVLIMTYPNPYALVKIFNYLRTADVSSSSFINSFLGSPDHLHFPTLPGLLRHASSLGLRPAEIAFMKGFGSNLPFINRFAAYVGIALIKEKRVDG